MTAIQIASSVIEKLQEQNRISLEALQKTQSDMRRLEKQLTEKEQLLKVMENKVRKGSNTYLEMSNRTKDISIKHLELQIQKLLKGNEDLERQVSLAKSDICEKCETKYFMGAAVDNKPASKSSVKKGVGKNASTRQVSEMETQKREKMLERIIEHKDKRIFSLTKEIQRLSQVEKELSKKVFRLTKLLPMSHLSTEVLTECLLKEIQSLELQIQHYQEKYDILGSEFGQSKSSKSYTNLFDTKSKTSLEISDADERTYSSSSRKVNKNFIGSSRQKNVNVSGGNVQQDNGSMVSKLHLLYNDVLELKQLFASENEKLFINLSKESLRYDLLKTQWEEVMGRLREIAESIENILQDNSQSVPNKKSDSNDKENIILRLQDRLKEALELTTQYENENSELKSTIERLKDQIQRDQLNNRYTQTDVRQSLNTDSPQKAVSYHSIDTQHLRELLNEKQKQLDSVQSHLKTYQSWVGQLQGVSIESLQSNLQKSSNNVNKNTNNQAMNTQSNNDVRRSANQLLSNRNVSRDAATTNKLEVAERNIKTLEDAIEGLQRVIQSLREKNQRLESEISLSNTNIEHSESLKAKLKESEEELVKIQSSNKDLENNVQSLEEENLSLQGSLQEVNSKLEQQQHEANRQQTSLQSKLNKAEKRVSSLEANLAHAQNSIEELKEDNVTLKSTLQTSESMKSLEAQAQKDDVMKLKNEIILKDREIQNLKESLHEIESKALEVSYHRKKLRQEIEKLCDVLVEKSDVNLRSDPNKSIENRKAIYKMAVLQSAKALLQLDEDYNVQSRTNVNGGALNEMSQQLSIYLTEVARINELLTIKNKQREDLLKEYLDESHQLSHFQGLSHGGPSGVVSLPASSTESSGESSSESGSQSSRRNKQTTARNTERSREMVANRHSDTDAQSSHRSKQAGARNTEPSSGVTSKKYSGTGAHSSYKETDERNAGSQTGLEPQGGQDAVTSHLLTRCSQLDDLLEKQQQDYLLSKNEVERLKENIADLQSQLNSKDKLSTLLNTLIELLRSKGCSSEIVMEQLKSDIKWLVAENQKLFDKSVMNQAELYKRKEENEIMKKDIENLRREHVNEMYDYAKTESELKHLREQALNNVVSMLNDENVAD